MARWSDPDELADSFERQQGLCLRGQGPCRCGRPRLLSSRATDCRSAPTRTSKASNWASTTDGPVCRHAGRHQPRRDSAPRARRCRQRRCTSATRRSGSTAAVRTLGTSRWRWKPAPACSTRSGTEGHAASMATKACARSRCTSDEHAGLVGHHRPGASPGSTSSISRDLPCSTRQCASAWPRLNPTRVGAAWPTACSRPVAARSTGQPDEATLAALRTRRRANSKTASKASTNTRMSAAAVPDVRMKRSTQHAHERVAEFQRRPAKLPTATVAVSRCSSIRA